MTKKIFFFLLAVLSLSTACKSKRLVNKAEKLDAAGLYSDAAEMFYQSLVANSNNIDAKLGLQRTGQLVLDDKYKAFKSKYATGEPKEAVYAWLDVESYITKVEDLGIRLIKQDEQKAYFNEVKDKYLNTLYQDAMKALTLEEFSAAEGQFAEIIRIDNHYKDAKTHWVTAKYEPIYRRGNKLLEASLYRSAYKEFNTIVTGQGEYKNSIALRADALENARITIAALNFSTSYTSQNSYADNLRGLTINAINNINSPFYQMVDDKSITSIYNWSALRDQQTAVGLARQRGAGFEAKSILYASISRMNSNTGRLLKDKKKGYLKRQVEVVNKTTNQKEVKTVYDKVYYYEYSQKNTYSLQVQYGLTRVDKDELAVSNSFFKSGEDAIRYASFEGDYKQLVPGTWESQSKESESDKVYTDSSSANALQALFTGNKEIKSTQTMLTEAFEQCAKQIAQDIEKYQPEN